MDHDTASQLLGAYALDACGQVETAEIEDNLLGCAPCRGQLATIRRASGWLGVTETAPPPAWLRAQILQQAEQAIHGPADRRGGVADRRSRGPRGGTQP